MKTMGSMGQGYGARRPEQARRFLSADACREVFRQLRRMMTGPGDLQLVVRSQQVASVRWARNVNTIASDTVDNQLYIARRRQGSWGVALVNRFDEASLLAGVRRAEQNMYAFTPELTQDALFEEHVKDIPELWSEATFAVDAAARAAVQEQSIRTVEAAGLQGAGIAQVACFGHGVVTSAGTFQYIPETRAQMCVMVRNSKGTASGWAGKTHREWTALDPVSLTATALDKCQRSEGAVAIEPGRYTVILEPQATADVIGPGMGMFSNRWIHENLRVNTWSRHVRQTVRREGAMGVDSAGLIPPTNMQTELNGNLKVDPRITMAADPMDSEMPFVPFGLDGSPIRPVTWVEKGVLRALETNRGFQTRSVLHTNDTIHNSEALRMAGGPTTIAEMIAKTERGLLVTRFDAVRLDVSAKAYRGYTADGLWLVEKGKIKMPVQNFQFLEIPHAILARVLDVGPVQRVMRHPPAIVPALRIEDFNMVRLANAV